MDSPPPEAEANNEGHSYACLRRLVVFLALALFAFISLSCLMGFVAVSAGNLSIANPISVPSQCKIVSSSVDLRSSKVCKLGLLNYRAKHVLYPFERKKFRCHYDYYWASIFQVEYRDHSGQTRFALAEAPNEALPLDCRPNFGAAWLTKDRFRVNKTYDCWYTFGISKVNIYDDNLFNCQAKGPSMFEMLKRYFILGRSRYLRWEVIAGAVIGFSTSLISLSLISVLPLVKSRICKFRVLPRASFAAHLKRACLFVAYFSFVGWLTMQYGKILGFPKVGRVQ